VVFAVGFVALGAWIFSRRRFETPAEAMVRIEASMRLRNRLSAAQAGVAPWPDAPESVDAGLRWRWSRLVAPPLAALACLAAGLFVPVSARDEAGTSLQEPLAWQEIESDLDLLENQQLAEKTYIEEMRKKLAQLRRQNPEDWFSHSSLEAGDHLRRTHRSEIQRVRRELERAGHALSALAKPSGGNHSALSAKQREKTAGQFKNAVKSLNRGTLKPDPALMRRLAEINPDKLSRIDPAQLEQLRKALRKCARGFAQCRCQRAGCDNWEQRLAEFQGAEKQGKSGNAPGKDADKTGMLPGRGGVTRGPGSTKAVLGDEARNLETGKLAGVRSKDLSNALPGNLVELENTRPDVDLSATAPRAGGAISSTGKGGQRIWRETLDPDEQRVVKRFFDEPETGN
jgi:hypothetical protein